MNILQERICRKMQKKDVPCGGVILLMPGYEGRFFFCALLHKIRQMLKTERRNYYKIKEGQTLRQVANYFSVSEYLLAKVNGLKEPIRTGQILEIPQESGNAYVVCEGDTKEKLCGSEENYFRKNGTDVFYIGMRIIL